MKSRKLLRVQLGKKHWRLLLKLVKFEAPPEFWKNFPDARLSKTKDAKGQYTGGLTEALERFLEHKPPQPPKAPTPDGLDHRYDVPPKKPLPRSPKGRAHSWYCKEKGHFVTLNYCQTTCERYILCDLVKEQTK